MAIASFDFAVLGSTPLARLLAGLLATAQGKRVCLVGETNSTFRLARGFDLSVAPVTRAETWWLLGKTVPEVQKLLLRAGAKSAIERVDPVFAAESSASTEMLAHLRHVAIGLGHAVDRPKQDKFGDGTAAVQVYDALLLLRPQLEPALDNWLGKTGLLRVASKDARVVVRRDGAATIAAGGDILEAAQTVLADDAAILQHLERDQWEKTLRAEGTICLMTEPTSPLAASPIVFLDRAVTLCQRSSRGIAAIALGRMDDALARIGASLVGQHHVRRAGQAVFRSLSSIDGGAVVGPLKTGKAIVLAGLGLSGAFLAPALARFIAGTASEPEMRYFSARAAGNNRAAVADYQRSAVAPASLEAAL